MNVVNARANDVYIGEVLTLARDLYRPLQVYDNPAVTVARSTLGAFLGVFAVRPISQNSWITEYVGLRCTRQSVWATPPRVIERTMTTHFATISKMREYIDGHSCPPTPLRGIAQFINSSRGLHEKTANARFRVHSDEDNRFSAWAIRDIDRDEEILVDYRYVMDETAETDDSE